MWSGAQSYRASLLLLVLLAACGRIHFERPEPDDAGMDAGRDAEPLACSSSAGCGPCGDCIGGSCAPLADGSDCEGGVCRDGVCCAGCVAAGACEPGAAPQACGAGGSACVACAECERCDGGTCGPAADGSECGTGVCVSGSCCTPSCAGLVCGDDGCGGSCGSCDVGQRCEGGSCAETSCDTDGDCLACEQCVGNVCVPQTDGAGCAGGTCHGGSCCAGCWDGAACREGSSVAACGSDGGSCSTCGACQSCAGGSCVAAADGTMCTGGRCFDSVCCAGCWDGTACHPGGSVAACGGGGDTCTACGACQSCNEGTCGFVADGTACAGGHCFGGACCIGCWDGTACQGGDTNVACGTAGGMCTTCTECQSCAGGACGPAPDGTACAGGQCRGSACCSGCWDGTTCQPGDADSACGSAGDMCAVCPGGEACIAGSCSAAPVCNYQCDVDIVGGVETCDGPVTGSIARMDEFTATIDMNGYTELVWTVTACNPSGWVAHITDSVTGDGGGGDGGTSSNDAEVNITTSQLLEVIGNQMDPAGPSRRIHTDPTYLPLSGCTTFVWTIADQFFASDRGGVSITDPYLLRINPPIDTEGVPDALWYVGLNRTWGAMTRTGSGVTSAQFCLR